MSPFGSNTNPSPQYVLSNSPTRVAKRPSRDRSQTISGSVSINGSSSLFGSAYSLSNSNSPTKERDSENIDSFEDLPTPLPSRSIGRRTELPAFNQGRRPSLPISMPTYPNPSSKSNSSRIDVESEDEHEEEINRLLFFAEQRAELPKFAVEDQPSLSSPMTRSKSSERISTPEDPSAISSKKKFKWNAAFGGGKAKTTQV